MRYLMDRHMIREYLLLQSVGYYLLVFLLARAKENISDSVPTVFKIPGIGSLTLPDINSSVVSIFMGGLFFCHGILGNFRLFTSDTGMDQNTRNCWEFVQAVLNWFLGVVYRGVARRILSVATWPWHVRYRSVLDRVLFIPRPRRAFLHDDIRQ